MARHIDSSQVRAFGSHLRMATPAHIEAIEKAMAATVEEVAEGARSDAPRDRPWLATEGIHTDVSRRGGSIRGAVYSPRDPQGRNVGVHVEFGTAESQPQPFLTPAFEAGRERFVAAVGTIIGRL